MKSPHRKGLLETLRGVEHWLSEKYLPVLATLTMWEVGAPLVLTWALEKIV
jgi:hypothetical protein